jgi:hypothetical protein
MSDKLLSEDLEYWRAERPDEWTMDRFIRNAKILEDELADIAEEHRQVMAEECPTDEKHCTCVPILRAEIDSLTAENERLRDGEEYNILQDRINELYRVADKSQNDKRELVKALTDEVIEAKHQHGYFSCMKGWPEKGRCMCHDCVTARSIAAIAKHGK